MQRGHFREIEQTTENPDAEPARVCAAAKAAIVVYGKRVGTTLTVCTDNDCPIHDPRAAARQAEDPAPVITPAPEAETEEQAEERRRQHEAQLKAHEEQQQRRDEERRRQFEREQKQMEAEAEKRDELRKAREEMFEQIVANAPPLLSAAQLRVILRALVNLDPYTFADDLSEDIAEADDNHSTEEVLLAAIDGTGDDKLTGFAVRLALAGHRAIPRQNEPDFLSEAAAAFLSPTRKANAAKARRRPTPIKPDAPTRKPKKKTASKGKIAA